MPSVSTVSTCRFKLARAPGETGVEMGQLLSFDNLNAMHIIFSSSLALRRDVICGHSAGYACNYSDYLK
jgi:hypothetical protein